MTFAVEFAEAARNDLFGILEFIAADNPRRGASFVDELDSFIRERLAVFRLRHSNRKAQIHRFSELRSGVCS